MFRTDKGVATDQAELTVQDDRGPGHSDHGTVAVTGLQSERTEGRRAGCDQTGVQVEGGIRGAAVNSTAEKVSGDDTANAAVFQKGFVGSGAVGLTELPAPDHTGLAVKAGAAEIRVVSVAEGRIDTRYGVPFVLVSTAHHAG